MAVGSTAGFGATGGYNSYCTFLGANSQVTQGITANNSTAIGTGATITQSNQIVLGTTAENILIPGSINIGENLTNFVSTTRFPFLSINP